MKRLADKVFDEKLLLEVISKYNDFAASKNTDLQESMKNVKDRILEIDRGIANIVNVVMQTGSAALSEKLRELETDKSILEQSLSDMQRQLSQMCVSEKDLKIAFKRAKEMLESGILVNKKAIIDRYVKQVFLYKDRIVIEFNVADDYVITEEAER